MVTEPANAAVYGGDACGAALVQRELVSPAGNGYSRAVPLRWLPAFTEKSQPPTVEPLKEWQASVQFLRWLRQQFTAHQRPEQAIDLDVRGRTRHLQVCVRAVFVRKGTPGTRLFLIVVRGKQRKNKYGRLYRRQPLPFLVNARQNETGQWVLPLPLQTLLFWAGQCWEVEVAHRELKTTFGLGHKQCFNPKAAVLSVQWRAWVYSLLLLAGYRTFGLARAPAVPTRWWRGAGRWSFATRLRAFRAATGGNIIPTHSHDNPR